MRGSMLVLHFVVLLGIRNLSSIFALGPSSNQVDKHYKLVSVTGITHKYIRPSPPTLP